MSEESGGSYTGQAKGTVRVVGAYAAQPAQPWERPAFARSVLQLPGVDGLEIPFGSVVYEQDAPWLWPVLPRGGRHVFTLIGATMERLAHDPGFGLASSDAAGRRAAVDLLHRTRDAVERAEIWGQRVVAVEVHSAPSQVSGVSGTGEALEQSLAEAAAWDWRGATLCVEHCDSAQPGRPFAKGFLDRDREFDAVHRALAREGATPVGVSINWGRSVIDARDARGARRDIEAARARDLLRGLILSGAADRRSPYGKAWADAHVPLALSNAVAGEPASLLTPERAAAAVRSAGAGLVFDGVKVTVQPASASPARRLAHVAAALSALG